MNNPFRVFYVFLVLLVIAACRKEGYELIEAPKEKNLEADSGIANLMQRTAMNDGSNDNIIDRANCFNVKLPLAVVANGQDVLIESESDYDLIEMIFDASASDEDVLTIQYPITILQNDYAEVVVSSKAELTTLASTCSGENEVDDDIECIDFRYPITASLYNIATELTDRVTITSDKQLYGFIDGLNDDLVVNVDFPLDVTLADGTDLIINTLVELEAAIEGAKDACDEDDDYDYNDDDEENSELSKIAITELLTSCVWEIEEIEVNGQYVTTTYEPYVFTFSDDGSVTANNNGAIINGSWVVSMEENGLKLNFTFEGLNALNNQWNIGQIHAEDDGTRLEIKALEDEVKWRQTCT